MVNNSKYFIVGLIFLSANCLAQNYDLKTMDRTYCEIYFIDQIDFTYSKIKEGLSRDSVISAFKTTYYTAYISLFYPNFADQVYDYTVTIGNEEPRNFVNRNFCLKLEPRVYHN